MRGFFYARKKSKKNLRCVKYLFYICPVKQLKRIDMTTVFHKNFGKGQLVSEDSIAYVINFETAGEKKLNKRFTQLLTAEQYTAVQSNPKISDVIKQPSRHELKLMTSSLLVDVLRSQEDMMQRNYYFDVDDVVNSEIYTDGVDYYNASKELIGCAWRLAMNFAKTRR